VLVEAPGGLADGIDEERQSGDLLARLQAAIHRAADQQLAQSAAPLFDSTRQPSHAEAGHQIARQPPAIRLRELRDVDFGGAERVATQHRRDGSGVDGHVRRTDCLAPMLLGVALQMLTEGGRSRTRQDSNSRPLGSQVVRSDHSP